MKQIKSQGEFLEFLNRGDGLHKELRSSPKKKNGSRFYKRIQRQMAKEGIRR